MGRRPTNDSSIQIRSWDPLESLFFTNSSNPNHHRSYQFYFLNISGIYCFFSILLFTALLKEFIFHLNHCNKPPNYWINIQLSKTRKILRFTLLSLDASNFMDVDRIHETPGSDTKDFTTFSIPSYWETTLLSWIILQRMFV